MRRRLGMIISLLCLLLSIATVVLWIRSYRVTTSAGYYAIDTQLNQCRRYDVTIAKAGFSLGYDRVTLPTGQELEIWKRNLEANYQKSPGTTRASFYRSLSGDPGSWALHNFFVEDRLAPVPSPSPARSLGFWADRSLSGPSRTSLLESGPAGLRIYNLHVTARDSAELHLPIWPLTVLLLLLGLPAIRRLRHYALRRRGFCRNCRYDLTGNLSGVCPECGTPTAKIASLPSENR